MSLTLDRLDQLSGEYWAESEANPEWDDVIAAARLQVAIDELPIPKGYRLHICQTASGQWMADILDGRGLGLAHGIRPSVLDAVLALKEVIVTSGAVARLAHESPEQPEVTE